MEEVSGIANQSTGRDQVEVELPPPEVDPLNPPKLTGLYP